MELIDTVEDMLSDDYKKRFLAEVEQLWIRLYRLSVMLEKWDAGTLDFTPTVPREVYDRQMEGMRLYMQTLRERAKIEGIKIPDTLRINETSDK